MAVWGSCICHRQLLVYLVAEHESVSDILNARDLRHLVAAKATDVVHAILHILSLCLRPSVPTFLHLAACLSNAVWVQCRAQLGKRRTSSKPSMSKMQCVLLMVAVFLTMLRQLQVNLIRTDAVWVGQPNQNVNYFGCLPAKNAW